MRYGANDELFSKCLSSTGKENIYSMCGCRAFNLEKVTRHEKRPPLLSSFCSKYAFNVTELY